MQWLRIALPVVLFAASPAFADDDDAAAPEKAVDEAAAAANADEREELMPAVSTPLPSGRRRAGGDDLVLQRTEITGNRELPKVLYIVPWQKSDPGALTGKPVNTLLDEVLAPLDREEFIRQVDYYSDLYNAPSNPGNETGKPVTEYRHSRESGDPVIKE